MGLFEKKFCDFCGEKIGLLGNRKLADGNMCKKCAGGISPFLTGRKEFTVDEMRAHLEYRDRNFEAVRSFSVTNVIGNEEYRLYVDNTKGQWFISRYENYRDSNPDIFDFSQVTSCSVEARESRREVQFKRPDGHYISYNPPEFDYDYDFYVRIYVNSDFTESIEIKLNSINITDAASVEYYEHEAAMNDMKYLFDQMANGASQLNIPQPFYIEPIERDRIIREKEMRDRMRHDRMVAQERMFMGPGPMPPHPGPDPRYGGPGPDPRYGRPGPDPRYGGPGPDPRYGGPGPDPRYGGPGPDPRYGGPGSDPRFGRR